MADEYETEQEVSGGGGGLVAKQFGYVQADHSYEAMISVTPDGVTVIEKGLVTALARALREEMPAWTSALYGTGPAVALGPDPNLERVARKVLARVFPNAVVQAS